MKAPAKNFIGYLSKVFILLIIVIKGESVFYGCGGAWLGSGIL